MASVMGIGGLPNTGKSFSRRSIKKGEKVFILSPNSKSLHIKGSNGEVLKPFDFILKDKQGNVTDLATAMRKSGKSYYETIKYAEAKKDSGEDLIFTGNYLKGVELDKLDFWLSFIDKNMPQINVVILGDFTHYLSRILGNEQFIKRKSGGEAFQRFWELAGDALNGVILSIDKLKRDNLLIITEYHLDYDEPSSTWELFVPGGKMLKEKFKLESYYDFLLFTTVIPDAEGNVTTDSYKFVTRRHKEFPARFQELFKDTFIPNDLELVIGVLEKDLGVKFLN